MLQRMFLALLLTMLFVLPAPASPANDSAADGLSAAEAHQIAIEAYTYLYPLVLMDVTRGVMTNTEVGVRPGAAPANQFAHYRAYPTAEMRDVVRPNFDTLYSTVWIDIAKEPVILSAPDTQGRYYLLPMIDMWTDVFASPGKRTSGTAAKHFALVQPNWKGQLPEGVERIDAPTPQFWIIGRTQTNGPADYEAVQQVQDGYRLTPLSQWGMEPVTPSFTPDPTIDMKTEPMVQVATMSAEQFFSRGARLMAVHPPHLADWSQVERLKRIGLEAGKPFDLSDASPEIRKAVADAPAAALALFKAKLPTLAPVVNGWQMNTDTMGAYGNYYLKRAIVAMLGLGANQPEDAIYPLLLADSQGKPLTGDKNYILHFEKSELPPVGAFWSITMYDEQGYQVANSLNRFAIGDRDALKYNEDGSLTLYFQHESPGAEKESNWLPAPKAGKLGITMRLYAPKAEALDGRWNPPAVKPAE